jgi:hypothetical protein
MSVLAESKKQLVALAFTIATVVLVSVTARFMDDPDAVRSLKMKTARRIQILSDRTALMMVNLADRADAAYKKEQP